MIKKIKEFGIANLTAIVSAVTLLGSILYNYSYFLTLNISFDKAPINFSDITISFFTWLPKSFGIALLSIFSALLMLEPKPAEKKEAQHAKNKPLWYKILKWIMIIGFFFSLAMYLFLGIRPAASIIFSFLILFIYFISLKISSLKVFQKYNRSFTYLIFYNMLTVFAWASYTGYKNANSVFYKNDIVITKSSIDEKNNLLLVRSLERGLLVTKGKNELIEFIPWMNVKYISYKDKVSSRSENKTFDGLICFLFKPEFCKRMHEANKALKDYEMKSRE